MGIGSSVHHGCKRQDDGSSSQADKAALRSGTDTVEQGVLGFEGAEGLARSPNAQPHCHSDQQRSAPGGGRHDLSAHKGGAACKAGTRDLGEGISDGALGSNRCDPRPAFGNLPERPQLKGRPPKRSDDFTCVGWSRSGQKVRDFIFSGSDFSSLLSAWADWMTNILTPFGMMLRTAAAPLQPRREGFADEEVFPLPFLAISRLPKKILGRSAFADG